MSRAATLALCTAPIALAACGDYERASPSRRHHHRRRRRPASRCPSVPRELEALRQPAPAATPSCCPRGWKASRERRHQPDPLLRPAGRDLDRAGSQRSGDSSCRSTTTPPGRPRRCAGSRGRRSCAGRGPFAHRYDGAEVAGRATARDGIDAEARGDRPAPRPPGDVHGRARREREARRAERAPGWRAASCAHFAAGRRAPAAGRARAGARLRTSATARAGKATGPRASFRRVRAMFWIYAITIVAGLAYFTVIGLTG